ncbi:protein APCDD1-like [Paramacrobiotus metropolitanus]|uniref:protein APCDD1-like n=1 Tax=Paramacrobiotus metropolitanus TaxID=2943436 RepID=UPI002445AFB0|nr:protein APCDD1-like [Paramacrobiotus metropolitanus]XP_055353533.1 protein APCDD1-like [Paramacrobiotus metropolitanus]
MWNNLEYYGLRWGLWSMILGWACAYVDEWSPCNVQEARVSTERPVALSGRWVSRRCELRAGPHYLLRAYEFGFNTSFFLHQFYYADNCVTPLHSLTIRGQLNEMKKSWLLPGAIDMDYTLTQVTVMPYSAEHAERLQAAVLHVCPLARFSAQPWTAYEAYEVLHFDAHPTPPPTSHPDGAGVTRIDVEFDCLEALNFTLDELQLVRLQRRRWVTVGGASVSRKELLTGESVRGVAGVGVDPAGMDGQRPVSYLPDFLVKVEDEHEFADCPVCAAVDSTISPSSPPILNASTHPPPYPLSDLSGKFTSLAECESRPSGSFIRRTLTLQPATQEWQGEYQHFTEPDCQQRSFTILGYGTFNLQEPYPLLPIAQKIDFLVINATVTPHLDFVLQQLSASNQTECGIGPWLLNRPKDITPTQGCKLLGLTIPNADFNIVRVERDVRNNTLLFLGQDYQDPPVEVSVSRPTSFQPPLIQCQRDRDPASPSSAATSRTPAVRKVTATTPAPTSRQRTATRRQRLNGANRRIRSAAAVVSVAIVIVCQLSRMVM